jgi:hypothetical protein
VGVLTPLNHYIASTRLLAPYAKLFKRSTIDGNPFSLSGYPRMEGFFLLVGLGVLALPVLAIEAWVRTGTLRRLLDDRYQEYERTVSDLKDEIAKLRRSLADVTAKPATTKDSASSETGTETARSEATTPPIKAPAYTPRRVACTLSQRQSSPSLAREPHPSRKATCNRFRS